MAEGLLWTRHSDVKPCDKCEAGTMRSLSGPGWLVPDRSAVQSSLWLSQPKRWLWRQRSMSAWIKGVYWGVKTRDLASQQPASKLHPRWNLEEKRTLSLTGCDPADLGCLPGWNGTSWQEKISPMSSAPHQDQQGMRMGWRNTKYRTDKGPGYSMTSDGEDLRATKVTP